MVREHSPMLSMSFVETMLNDRTAKPGAGMATEHDVIDQALELPAVGRHTNRRRRHPTCLRQRLPKRFGLVQVPIEVTDDHESTTRRLRGNPGGQHGQLPVQFGASTSGFVEWTLPAAGLEMNGEEPKRSSRRPKMQDRPGAKSSNVERFQVRTVLHSNRFSNRKPDALGAVAGSEIEAVAFGGDSQRGSWATNLLQGDDVSIEAGEVSRKTLVIGGSAPNGSGPVSVVEPGDIPGGHLECWLRRWSSTRSRRRAEKNHDHQKRSQPSRSGRRGLKTP
jgi:hypothetical protein